MFLDLERDGRCKEKVGQMGERANGSASGENV